MLGNCSTHYTKDLFSMTNLNLWQAVRMNDGALIMQGMEDPSAGQGGHSRVPG